MLSLLPALLLLAFQGPAALERIGHGDGRLPEALRALERAFTAPESSIAGDGEESAQVHGRKVREAMVRLAGLTSDAALSAAIAELLSFGTALELPKPVEARLDREPLAVKIASNEGPTPDPAEGFAEQHPSRDGPIA